MTDIINYTCTSERSVITVKPEVQTKGTIGAKTKCIKLLGNSFLVQKPFNEITF